MNINTGTYSTVYPDRWNGRNVMTKKQKIHYDDLEKLAATRPISFGEKYTSRVFREIHFVKEIISKKMSDDERKHFVKIKHYEFENPCNHEQKITNFTPLPLQDVVKDYNKSSICLLITYENGGETLISRKRTQNNNKEFVKLLNSQRKAIDFSNQLIDILLICRKYNYCYNDVNCSNIVVKKGVYKIIDYESSINYRLFSKKSIDYKLGETVDKSRLDIIRTFENIYCGRDYQISLLTNRYVQNIVPLTFIIFKLLTDKYYRNTYWILIYTNIKKYIYPFCRKNKKFLEDFIIMVELFNDENGYNGQFKKAINYVNKNKIDNLFNFSYEMFMPPIFNVLIKIFVVDSKDYLNLTGIKRGETLFPVQTLIYAFFRIFNTKLDTLKVLKKLKIDLKSKKTK